MTDSKSTEMTRDELIAKARQELAMAIAEAVYGPSLSSWDQQTANEIELATDVERRALERDSLKLLNGDSALAGHLPYFVSDWTLWRAHHVGNTDETREKHRKTMMRYAAAHSAYMTTIDIAYRMFGEGDDEGDEPF